MELALIRVKKISFTTIQALLFLKIVRGAFEENFLNNVRKLTILCRNS